MFSGYGTTVETVFITLWNLRKAQGYVNTFSVDRHITIK